LGCQTNPAQTKSQLKQRLVAAAAPQRHLTTEIAALDCPPLPESSLRMQPLGDVARQTVADATNHGIAAKTLGQAGSVDCKAW
jgi:hypothetical protein